MIINNHPNIDEHKHDTPIDQKEPTKNQDGDSGVSNNDEDKESNDSENKAKQFPKLFDYIINFPKVNIGNFDNFARSLLKDHEEDIYNLIGKKDDLSLESIDGGQWLIKGKNVDIRQIKDRLNKFFALYNVLKSKFPNKDISIRKCVGAVYLQSEYENDFYSSKDASIDFIINSYLSPDNKDFKEGLIGLDQNYIDAVLELYKSQYIGKDYRIYFYNYPVGDTVYDYDENIVFDAIFNNIANDNLDISIENCKKSDVFNNSFKK